jgi:hypothetical protein
MPPITNLNEYLQLFRSAIGRCNSIPNGERHIPWKKTENGKVLLFNRGPQAPPNIKESFKTDSIAMRPLGLEKGGSIEVFLQVQVSESKAISVAAYRIAFLDIPQDGQGNRIQSLRFECEGKEDKKLGWDDELEDNPQHPNDHLHINFDASPTANDLRLAVGRICPMVLIRSFDYWYWKTFVQT